LATLLKELNVANKIDWYPEPIKRQVVKVEPVIDPILVIAPVETKENLAKRMNKLLSNIRLVNKA
jgi:hypothetical protein